MWARVIGADVVAVIAMISSSRASRGGDAATSTPQQLSK